ncbi:uncharacterized protein [Coffea arabica]|uniref:Uncharacterized protein n=1 Tax=Coffea arabica TaxID=13443 RepID=A0A6P6U0H7_COFAR|nr:uncharacterized protein LOC113706491 [Coffea arabica]
MAASSPALSNNSNDTPSSSGAGAATFNVNTPPSAAATSKNLRGLNKPKCIKCGNVARSRCPYQSCKSCCAKAQNPCHIHVLKGGSNIPDKINSSSSPATDPQSADISHSGNSHRVASLRQLSNTFAQFNNLQTPVRSRKPLTRKDAQVINEWRFLKLKEFRDRNIEAENEAFDRYMRNVSLLEEVFCVNSALDGQSEEGSSAANTDRSVDDCNEIMVPGLKLKLRSNPVRIENFRKRVQYIVDQGLRELNKLESNDGNGELGDPDEMGNRPKKMKSSWRAERASALSDLIDKLNKARNEEDLKACFDMYSRISKRASKTSQVDSVLAEASDEQNPIDNLLHKERASYAPPKWFSSTPIDQESLCRIDSYFCSLEDVEDL